MKKLGMLGLLCAVVSFSICSLGQEAPAAAKKNTRAIIVVAVNGLSCSTTLGPGTIEILSWSFGASNTASAGGTGSGGSAGKAAIGDLTVNKRWDDCSPQLFAATVSGKSFKTVTLTQSDKNNTVLLTITLTNALLSSFQLSGDQSDEFPTESLSFDFQKICIKDANGGAQACFDKSTNTGS